MTINREYGPFKGISNSGNLLTPIQGYVKDARNIIVDQDTGELRKRDGVLLRHALDGSNGIARFISDQIDDTENLFIAGPICNVIDEVNSALVPINDFRQYITPFPDKEDYNFFSSFMHNGCLYFNYGGSDRIYKYDGQNVSPASLKNINAGEISPFTNKYLWRVYGCDAKQDVAFIIEKEFKSASGSVTVFGLAPNNFEEGENTHYADVLDLAPTNAAEVEFTVNGTNTLVVGDPVYIAVSNPNRKSYPEYERREYRKFIVSSSNPSKIKVLNPQGYYLKVEIIQPDDINYGGMLAPFIGQLFVYDPNRNIYVEAMALDGTLPTGFESQMELPLSFWEYPIRVLNPPTVFPQARVYSYPEFSRKPLPKCKHISKINGLMIMCCPKVEEGLRTDDEDFQYQTLAWSSENPEDPIETWGGMSAIIGSEEEGRIYACVSNNGILVIFKERAIYVTQPPMDGIIEPQKVLGSSVGCNQPESIQECNGVLFFYVEGKGVYNFRAGMAQAQESTVNFRGIFKTLTGRATSSHDIKNSRYILSVGGLIFIYDYLVDSWWIWEGFNATKGMEYFKERIFGVDSTNNLFSLDNVLKDDLGVEIAIPAFIITSWFGAFDAEVDKKLKALRIWSLNGSNSMLVEALRNFRNTIDYSFLLEGTEEGINTADYVRSESGKRKFKTIAFKISNATIDEDMKISGWAIDYESTGFESKNFEGLR